jgi:hypothetical protein
LELHAHRVTCGGRLTLTVYGLADDGVTAFTQDGIEGLRQIIEDERDAGRTPPKPGDAK